MKKFAALSCLVTTVAWITASPALARGRSAERWREEMGDAKRTVASFRAQPELKRYFENAYAYAVFPTVGTAAFFLGGAYGTGMVYEEGRLAGSAKLTKASIGFQVGGEAYSEIIFFRSRHGFERFKRGGVAFEAGVSAAAGPAGAGLEAPWRDGVAIFTLSKGGLMARAAAGGQTFAFEPLSRGV